MMTSSNGNIFRVTGPWWGESTGHRWFPHKGQWRGALMFSLIFAWINVWANNRYAGDLRRHHPNYGVTEMEIQCFRNEILLALSSISYGGYCSNIMRSKGFLLKEGLIHGRFITLMTAYTVTNVTVYRIIDCHRICVFSDCFKIVMLILFNKYICISCHLPHRLKISHVATADPFILFGQCWLLLLVGFELYYGGS